MFLRGTALRQARPTHDRCIKAATRVFDEPIEIVGIEDRAEAHLERMARRLRQVGCRDPQSRLFTRSGSHHHPPKCSLTARFWRSSELVMQPPNFHHGLLGATEKYHCFGNLTSYFYSISNTR